MAGVPELRYVNLGVLPARDDTRKLSKAINVTADDVEVLKRLLANGVKVDIQQVPTESAISVTEKLLNT